MSYNASLVAMTKKGFTPLHLAAKYGNLKVSNLILEKNHSPEVVDSEGKNGVTPLHVAAHYDHQNVALLLLDKVKPLDINLPKQLDWDFWETSICVMTFGLKTLRLRQFA